MFTSKVLQTAGTGSYTKAVDRSLMAKGLGPADLRRMDCSSAGMLPHKVCCLKRQVETHMLGVGLLVVTI